MPSSTVYGVAMGTPELAWPPADAVELYDVRQTSKAMTGTRKGLRILQSTLWAIMPLPTLTPFPRLAGQRPWHTA
jgi:hypothetical protein